MIKVRYICDDGTEFASKERADEHEQYLLKYGEFLRFLETKFGHSNKRWYNYLEFEKLMWSVRHELGFQ